MVLSNKLSEGIDTFSTDHSILRISCISFRNTSFYWLPDSHIKHNYFAALLADLLLHTTFTSFSRMPQLLDLPVEILNEIVLNFVKDYYKSSLLLHLCMTCQKLRDIVQPILFRRLDIRETYKESAFTTRFLTMTRAIIHRPDLAQSVRMVDMNLGRNYKNQRLIPRGLDFSDFQTAGLEYFTDMTRWEPTLPWSDHGASRASIDVYPHVCMLLSFLPKLEILRICSNFVTTDIHCITDLVERLPNLKEITTLFPGRHEVKFHWRELVLLLSLPRLQILKLKGLNMRSISSKPCNLLPGSLGIKQLSLRQCTTRDSRMQQLITACKELTHFTYTRLSEDAEEDPNPEPWHTALSLHKGSLLELNLNFLDKRADDSDSWDRPVWSSFSDFSTLKSLKVDYRRVQLSGLPKTLETLRLSDCWVVEPEVLDRLSAMNKEACPNIRNVEVAVTFDCRINRDILRVYGFRWHDVSEKSMGLPTIEFSLKHIMKEFADGTISMVSPGNLCKRD